MRSTIQTDELRTTRPFSLRRQGEFAIGGSQPAGFHADCAVPSPYRKLPSADEPTRSPFRPCFDAAHQAPYGEIDDLRQARQALHPDICTRGNLDTEIMRSGTPQQIVETVTSIIDATWGYRHIVGLADSLLWGTPIDNVRCMVQAAKTHYANRNGIHPATTENHGPDSALE